MKFRTKPTSIKIIKCIIISLFAAVLIIARKENSSIRQQEAVDTKISYIGSCPIKPLRDQEQYYSFLEKPGGICIEKTEIGWYTVCLDRIRNGSCLVYSFGIGDLWLFDDGMDKEYGCKVHAFDPTNGLPNHQRSPNIQFYSLGLSSFKGTKGMSYIDGKHVNAKVDTYLGILENLNHTNAKIDILKVDIEGSELDFILEASANYPEVFKNVEQVLMEIHTLEKWPWHTGNHRDTTEADYWKLIQLLQCHRFRLIHSQPIRGWLDTFNFYVNRKIRSHCYETSWVRDLGATVSV